MASSPKPKSSSPTATKVSRSRDPLTLNQATSLGNSSSPLTQIPLSALRDLSRESLPTPDITDVHALHDNIPVADDGLPPTNSSPTPRAPCPKLLKRLSGQQRTSFLCLWDQFPLHLRDIAFDLRGSGWTPSVITALGDVLCGFTDVSSKPRLILARALLFRSRSPSPRTESLSLPVLAALIPSSASRKMWYSTNTWPPASPNTRHLRTPAPWSPSPRKTATSE